MAWYDENRERADDSNEFDKEAIMDLQQVLATPYGYSFMYRLLVSLGAERRCSADTYSIALRDKAEELLDMCGKASFKKMLQLISDIRSNKHGRSGNGSTDNR